MRDRRKFAIQRRSEFAPRSTTNLKISTLLAAYALDLALGDPQRFPHPVRLIGKLIVIGEPLARRLVGSKEDAKRGKRDAKESRPPDAEREGEAAKRSDIERDTPRVGEIVAGALLTASVISTSYVSARALLRLATKLDERLGVLAEVLLAWTTLATGSLLIEAGAVLDRLEADDLGAAQSRLARIVGRDTDNLDETEVARGVIETVAESTCDGIIAPLTFLVIGGVPLAFAYKAVNTLDSMIGHIEPPYTYFGRVAARADDAANFIPARLTALLLICAAALTNADARQAWRILRRDAQLHKSPNAGQSEATMAGALRVRLGGVNTYDGVPHAGAIFGSEHEPPTAKDARGSLRLALTASLVGCAVACLFLVGRR